MSTANPHRPLIFVTGATGYIGGRLVPRLLALGYRVRCLVRDPARLQGRPWHNAVELVAGDVLLPDGLAPALQGVQVAYYLVHCQHRLRKSADQRFRMSPDQRAKCPLGCATVSPPLGRIRLCGSAT
jgi:uncharacterized protein YbjT (DUF2867 family)